MKTSTVTIHYRDQFGHTSRTCRASDVDGTVADIILDKGDPISATVRVGRRIKEIILGSIAEICNDINDGLDRLERW